MGRFAMNFFGMLAAFVGLPLFIALVLSATIGGIVWPVVFIELGMGQLWSVVLGLLAWMVSAALLFALLDD